MSEFYRLDINDDLWVPIRHENGFLPEDIDWANIRAQELKDQGDGKFIILNIYGQPVEGLFFEIEFGPSLFVTKNVIIQLGPDGRSPIKFQPRIPVERLTSF